jgi:signal transduction histidine kinase/DNA-binding LacI/PurR family transcriptional regulator/ActR/RegA family two-component response regulator
VKYTQEIDQFDRRLPRVGVLIEPGMNRAVGYSLARGATMAASCFGCRIMVSSCIETLLRMEPMLDGIVSYQNLSDFDPVLRFFSAKNKPIVTLDYSSELSNCEIHLDGHDSFFRLTSMLIEKGHRQIAFIGGVEDYSESRQRLKGYQDALELNGIEVDSNLIRHTGSWIYDEVKPVVGEFIESASIDAVVCSSDAIAFAAIERLQATGRAVPANVSVVGYDNFLFRHRIDPSLSDPPLTNGVYPSLLMGYTGVEQALVLLDGRVPNSKEIILESSIAERGSVADRRSDQVIIPPQGQLCSSSFNRLSTMIDEFKLRLINSDDAIKALSSYFIEICNRGYNDYLATAIFNICVEELKRTQFDRLSSPDRERICLNLSSKLMESRVSKNYRDFHLNSALTVEDAFFGNQYVTLTIQDRESVVNLVDRLRSALGMSCLCLEFIDGTDEYWVCHESEDCRCLTADQRTEIETILFLNNIHVQPIRIADETVALLYVDDDVQRELDLDRMVYYIASVYLQANIMGALHERQLALELAKKNAEQARKQAEQASRAKSDFLAMMSHEIRTPLNGVIGCSSLLEGTKLNAEQLELVSTMRSSGENLLVIINDILDFSKIEAGKIDLEASDFDLRECIKETLDLFSIIATEKKIKLSYQMSPKVPSHVIGDVNRFRQVLVNLVGNAIKFTEDGEIVLRVDTISMDTELGSCQLEISVSDTGIGIPDEVIPQLFTQFTQADRSMTRKFGGTGLGLAICKNLTELMGGGISVSSEIGKGSVFTIHIKLGISPEASHLALHTDGQSVTDQQKAAEDSSSAGKRVLVVDDNHVNQRVAFSMLRKIGYSHVDCVSDGDEAVTAVSEGSYDIVLMDVSMPRMSGIEATRLIRELPGCNRDELAILGVSAGAIEGDSQQALDAGMNDYLNKPFKLQDIRTALEKL